MLKNICAIAAFTVFISACHNSKEPIVNQSFVDSLIVHYTPGISEKMIDGNLVFWKKRMDSNPDNFVNGPEYAAALISKFHLSANIHDLRIADSLVQRSNEANKEKEAGIFRTLASLCMLQHKFIEADSLVKRAIEIEGTSFPNVFTDFDISFERGDYAKAKKLLSSMSKGNSYGYLFRRSKYEHYDGSLDSAISFMMQAADKAQNNNYFKQIALSNAADLFMHKGDLGNAYDLYVQSIMIDAADFHSIIGIGWISLVHDKNDSLTERIFRFAGNHQESPDKFLKLIQVAEAKKDSSLQKKYAIEFETEAKKSVYGAMYRKYLIDFYTGILHEPAKAVELAASEINNRPTPQVFAWYAWSLFCNNEKNKAYDIYKGYVSGKPLEGLELYYMGKLMQGLNKGYNAEQFFKTAYKNRYDLSPAKQQFLEDILE